MPRATTAVTLLFCLGVSAGCSASAPETTASSPTKAASATGSQVTALGAAGLEGLSAQEIWSRATVNLDSTRSFHVAARLPGQDGKEVRFNFTMTDTGRAFGTMQTGTSNVLIRRFGKVLYFRGNRGFWDEDGSEPKTEARAGRWFKVTQGGKHDLKEFFDLTDLDAVLDKALSLSEDEVQDLTVVPGNPVYDRPTIGLAGAATKAADRIFVSADGPRAPELLQVGSANPYYLRFDTWNQPVQVFAPKGAVNLP